MTLLSLSSGGVDPDITEVKPEDGGRIQFSKRCVLKRGRWIISRIVMALTDSSLVCDPLRNLRSYKDSVLYGWPLRKLATA
jgi:hypothetical protein